MPVQNSLITIKTMIQSSLELATVFQLIGRLWLREVDSQTLVAMGTKNFRDAYQELGGFVPTDTSEARIEKLAIEYCGILIGPKGQLSPVQSVWASSQFQSTTCSSMKKFFDLLPGYTPDSNLADHIGVQLDFLSHLIQQQDEATSEIVGHFAQTHLKWAIPFLEKVQLRDSEFYGGLARVTQDMINSLR